MAGPENDGSPAKDTPDDAVGKRAQDRPADSRRRGLRRPFALALGVFALAGLVFWFGVIPYPRGLAEENPGTTAVMEQRRQEARARGDTLEIRQTWVGLDEISSNLARAVIVAEDYRFRQHEGIDWVSLAEEVEWTGDDDFSWWSASDLASLADAVAYVWSNRSELRGRSTITQQLAKNLYFGTDRSLLRKAMEAVVARRLERSLSKDRILELYLNIAEWGPGVFGAEAASRAYFGRPAARLSLDQAAALAATLPHPLTSNPASSPARMLWRKDLILDRIDPARGVPSEPMPLPDPALELELPDLDDPELDVPGLDTASPDTLASPDTGAVQDTLALPDTLAPPDTITTRDTLERPDTTADTLQAATGSHSGTTRER